jgi:hypothetical protein
MAILDPRRRRTRRLWASITSAAALTAVFLFVIASASGHLTGSTFGGGDGNLACNDVNGALDWNCLTTGGSPQLHTGTEQFTGQQDNSFGQGTKENNSDVTLVQGSIPPNKSDLTRFYEASEVLSVSGSPHVFLYLAWERSNVLGSANMDFEINKTGTPCLDSTGPFPVDCTINRSNGDILVTYDFTNGGGNPSIGLRTWNGSSWQTSSSVVSESAVNSGNVTDTHLPAGSQTVAANEFGEVSIDLTASGLATGCGFSNATTFLKSRSSAQFQSEVKDFVAPISTPIAPCAPGITTTLSATSVPVGSAVHDSAALSGATSDAGGTVTYTVYTDSACTQGAQSAGTVTVTNGVVPDSSSITFNSAGTFYWQAVYSGDGKNSGATSACQSETLVVTPLQPSMSTAQHLIPNDDATLSGATSNAGGTITFNLFSPSDATCAGTPALTQTVNVSGNGTYSTTNTTFIASTEGTWRWQVVYSGDNNNQSATSTCGVERFTIANS